MEAEMKTTRMDPKDLVFIPYGADKGDCPFCNSGVLARDIYVENSFCVREGYSCDICGTAFIEAVQAFRSTGLDTRYFVGVGQGLNGVYAYSAA
jgi:hypothetical protein